jgi:hypothetical protein
VVLVVQGLVDRQVSAAVAVEVSGRERKTELVRTLGVGASRAWPLLGQQLVVLQGADNRMALASLTAGEGRDGLAGRS